MKIGIVTESYYPAVGGIAEHVINLAKVLRERGHTVKILTSSYGEMADAPFNSPDVIRLGKTFNFQKNGTPGHIAYGWHLSKKIRKVLAEEKFDLLHYHGPEQPTLPMLALLNSTTVNVGTFHATYDRSLPLGFLRPVVAKALAKLHARIVVSPTAKESISKYFSEGEYEIVHNGIEVERFASGKALEQYADRPNIVFVGNFVLRKGFVNLMEAFTLVQKSIPNVRLIAVGDGVLRARYEKSLGEAVGKDVIFTGRVSTEELSNYYASAEVFCSPATGRESFGIVHLEAMAAGRPVVATNIAGYKYVLENTGAALLVNPNDIKGLAQALLRVLTDKNLANQMSEAGKKTVEKFRWADIGSQVEAVYVKALERFPQTLPVVPGYRWLTKLFNYKPKVKKALTNE